jgi:cytochrome c oxidase subunit 2
MGRDWIPFWQPDVSAYAAQTGTLFIGLIVVSALVIALLMGLVITFAVKYRAGRDVNRSHQTKKSWHWEIGWTAITLAAFFGLFSLGRIPLSRRFGGTADGASNLCGRAAMDVEGSASRRPT